jgi:uncharacterized protein YegJ (DUF2314 family)
MKHYILLDAEEMSIKFPETFQCPSNGAIEGLKNGDQVQLGFKRLKVCENGPNAERMWVTIQSIDGLDFIGELDNDPVLIPHLKYGATIIFQRRNIYKVYNEFFASAQGGSS